MAPPIISAAGLGVLMALTFAGNASAEVVDAVAGGFTLRESAVIAAPPAKVWAALGQVGRWWDPQHSYSRDGRNLSIDLKVGGCWCEVLPGGGGVGHMIVVNLRPGQSARFVGALGPLQAMGVAGAMTWTLEGDKDHTTVTWTYDVGGHAQGGLDKLAAPVDGVLGDQVRRLKSYVETGAP